MATWKDKNIVIGTARAGYKLSGAQAAAGAVSRSGVGLAGDTASAVRSAVFGTVVDPVLGKAAKKLTDVVAGHELPGVSFYEARAAASGNGGMSKEAERAAADRIPMRMFNLETRKLDSNVMFTPREGVEYCILSHSWKGCEVDYAFVDRVRKRDAKRMKCEELLAELKAEGVEGAERAAAEWECRKFEYLRGTCPDDNDVAKIKRQCEEDLRTFKRQVRKEFELVDDAGVTQWLRDIAEGGFEAAAGDEDKKMRMRELGKRAEMLLQQRKSADKIENTVQWARAFFNKRPGSADNKKTKYVWIDTCCINKGMVGEYNESIALMGEWYTNAEFCLVHLDSPPVYQRWTGPASAPSKEGEKRPLPDWFCWWELFMAGSGSSVAHQKKTANFAKFPDINQPYWSERAWTLQELALSKITHFFNDHWEHLGQAASMSIDEATQMDPERFTIETAMDDAKTYEIIAAFSNVPVEEVCRGARKSRLPAFDLMRLSSERRCTVATDQAYSLMGMLDVKFPGFSAEGLTKALSRLLDEVITTSNDVSVFNWDGKNLGSDIVGRSLYPKDFTAFSPKLRDPNSGNANKGKESEEDRSMNAPASLNHSKDMEIYRTYKELEAIISDVQDFVKEPTTTPETVALLQGAIKWILDNQVAVVSLNKMETEQMRNIAKAFRAIKTGHKDLLDVFELAAATVAEDQPDERETSPLIRPFPSFEMPSTKGFGFGRKSSAPTVAKADKPAPPLHQKLSLSDSVGKFFRPHEADKRGFPKYLVTVVKGVLPPAAPQQICEAEGDEQAAQENKDDNGEDESKAVDKGMLDKLAALFKTKMNQNYEGLVAGLVQSHKQKQQQADNHRKTQEGGGTTDGGETTKKARTISPNPIIVTSSGLMGVFDVQRVITTIRNAGRMREQIKEKYEAANPSGKVDGACDISTGCAVITVNFSCPAYVLEKQLDVEGVVQETVLNLPRRQAVKQQSPTAEGTEDTESKENTSPSAGETADTKPQTPTGDGSPLKAEGEARKAKPDITTPENVSAQKVQRVLAHVQQPDINLVAGEWVLARFSGVPSADWFLCQLELGSTHEFYGWRIPTDKIDFKGAKAEDELRNLWRAYMEKKKLGLCSLLKLALEKKKSIDDEERKLKQVEDGLNTEEVSKTQLVKSGVVYLGTWARTRWLDWEESRCTQILRDEALQRAGIPKSLYAAVLTLERSATLPTMYFASRQVHMF